MLIKRRLGQAVAVALSFLMLEVHAQDPLDPNIIPPSPQAASLGKYVEIPVSAYTGVPNINIPIYEVQSGSITMPISLSYHASGVKVGEYSSWVGTNWTLNAGGVVTRNIRGRDDFGLGGFLSLVGLNQIPFENILDNCIGDSTGVNHFPYLSEVLIGNRDSEPDMFFFNFANYSGKFFFDKNGTAQLISKQDLDISSAPFKIIAPDGVQYFFGEYEEDISEGEFNDSFITAWYLTKIMSPTGDSVTLEYEKYNAVEYLETYSYSALDVQESGECEDESDRKYQVTEHSFIPTYLKKITFDNGYIDFKTSEQRCDLPGARRLENIEVYNNLGIKKLFNLNYANNTACNRQWLTNFVEKPVNGPGQDKIHSFFYNQGYIPPQNSTETDHWGYYTNSGGHPFLKNPANPPGGPIRIELLPYEIKYGMILGGINKEPNVDYMQRGLLNKIIYPTGGHTSFEYEPDDYSNLKEIEYEYNYPTYTVCLNNPECESNSTANFTIEGGEQAEAIVSNFYFEDETNADFFVTLKKDNNFFKTFYSQEDTEDLLILDAGDYTIEAETEDGESTIISFTLKVRVKEDVLKSKIGGGVRIKKIVDYDGIDLAKNIVRTFDYSKNGLSSGRIMSEPLYTRKGPKETETFVETGLSKVQVIIFCEYIERFSSSLVPLGNTSGSYVGYDRVSVLYGENGENGKTTFDYINIEDTPGPGQNGTLELIPISPNISYGHKNGLLRKSVDYKFESGGFLPVRKVTHNYGGFDQNVVIGLKTFGIFPESPNPVCIRHYHYASLTSWIHRNESIETQYNRSGDSIQTQKQFFYNGVNHRQLTGETLIDSQGQFVKSRFKYPLDYVGPISEAIDSLQARHIVSPIIEQTQWTQMGPDSLWTSGQANRYYYNSELDIVLPEKIYLLENVTPLPSNAYSQSIDGQTFDDDYELRALYRKYDSRGNIIEFSTDKNVVTSYIWGYNKSLPIAEIVNADYDQVVAELPNGAIDLLEGNSLSADEIRSMIDVVRNALPNAEVNCYTHDPLVGMTSSTDQRGFVKKYEYDEFYRLKLIRDENNKILQKFEYKYHHDGRQ